MTHVLPSGGSMSEKYLFVCFVFRHLSRKKQETSRPYSAFPFREIILHLLWLDLRAVMSISDATTT